LCLDLACGTGDVTLLLAERFSEGHVVGLDITESMLALARARTTDPNIRFVNQDMGCLKFCFGFCGYRYPLKSRTTLNCFVNDRLDAITIWIENKRGVIVFAIFWM